MTVAEALVTDEPAPKRKRGPKNVVARTGKDGVTRYYIRPIDADGQRHTLAAKMADGAPARTERQAVQCLHDAEAAARRGEQIAKEKLSAEQKRAAVITIRELAKRFTDEGRPMPRKGYKPTERVIRHYRSSCRSLLKRHVLDRLGDQPAASVDRRAVEKMRNEVLERGFGDDTVGKLIGVLSRLYEWALVERLIACPNPCDGISRPKAVAGCPDFLDADAIGTLLAGIAANPFATMLHAMVALAVYCGLRKGELFGLTWSRLHIDDSARVDVERSYDAPPKNGINRTVAIHPAALAILRQWRQHCPATANGLVFPMPGKGGYRMGRENDMVGLPVALQTLLGRSYKRCWHLLRHSFASNMAMTPGVSLYDLQKLLGHLDIKQTMKYAKLSPEHLSRQVAKLKFEAPLAADIASLAAARAA